ncbi:MAG: 6-carboxytetrahydropterin synthase [Pseudomonadota bacterium]
MFEISVKKSFSASHALHNGGMLIEELHDHAWQCEVVISADELDKAGVAVDFRKVDEVFDRAIESIAGRSLHETKEFANKSPSAENVAVYLYTKLTQELGNDIMRVRVWEDEAHSATYYATK